LNQWEPGASATTLTGDANGPVGSTIVSGLRGRAISAAAPLNGQVLRWDGTSSQWEPGGAAGNYAASFTAQTSLLIPGSAHGYQSSELLVECFDSTDKTVDPDSVSINATTYDVTVEFAQAQSGSCVVNGGSFGTSGGSGTGSGSISSVFGRTGAITAQTGDYSFAQMAGTVANAQLASGIDAAKIGAGTVSTPVFGYLANVASDIQGQLNGKVPVGQALSGDVTGTLGRTVVTGLRGYPVAATPASDGQVLTWSAALSQWQPESGGGSGGSGAALSTLAVGLSSPTVLTIGASCSAATPCNVRFGSTVKSIQTAATATISAGNGLAFIYVDQNGVLTVGHNLTLACSAGCQAVTGVSAFPNNTIPIATWNATSGTWDAQGTDGRAWLATALVNAGQGIMVVNAGAASTVAVDAAVVPTYLSGSATLDFPAIAQGACSADMSIPVTGAALGNSVAPGWPGLPAGVWGTMYVSAANTVSARLCNLSGMVVDPVPAVYNAVIIRSF